MICPICNYGKITRGCLAINCFLTSGQTIIFTGVCGTKWSLVIFVRYYSFKTKQSAQSIVLSSECVVMTICCHDDCCCSRHCRCWASTWWRNVVSAMKRLLRWRKAWSSIAKWLLIAETRVQLSGIASQQSTTDWNKLKMFVHHVFTVMF